MLDDNYYLRNFEALIGFVAETYADVLTGAENDWQRAVLGASEPARRLYIRLLGRQGEVFRLSKLKYPEISSIAAAASELEALALVSATAPVDIEAISALFTKPELIRLLTLTGANQSKRGAIVDAIVEKNAPQDLLKLQQADAFVTIRGKAEFALFKLCFFGNGYQDMSEFVLRDLGVFSYEPYPITRHSRVFGHRDQIDAHLLCMACGTALESTDVNDADALITLTNALPSNLHNDPHLGRRVDRIRNHVARQLERIEKLEEAELLYRRSTHPPARERRVRVLMKLKQFHEAADLCESMLQQPITEEEVQFVETIQPKLRRQMNLPAIKKTRFKPNTSKLTLSNADERVEFTAKKFFSQYGDCYYVENSLINGVLGLFIWDIIFAAVEGVFYNPFQSAPADFYQPEFCTKRSALIEQRFTELDDTLQFSARVWDNFESRSGTVNPLVNWNMLSSEILSCALIRIPVEHWRLLFTRILSDLKRNTSGLPDLILFPRSGGYELLEIKGPGDAVQKNQRRWMAYFAEHRIPYRVIHIRWGKQAESV